LKYIAELTGIPMAKVVNYMILLLIFVFDPLAIALVLATNKAFDLAGESTPLEPKKDSTKEVLEEILEELKHEHEHEESVHEEPIHETNEIEGASEGLNLENEGVIEEPITPEPIPEPQPPVEMPRNNPVTSSKIALEDIKEIKEGNRGYSVPVPQPKGNNAIERIGSNKVIKDGDNNKFFFKRN
jgi:hypothetical protein